MTAVIKEPLKDIAQSFDRAIKMVIKSKEDELRAIEKKEQSKEVFPAQIR